MSCYHPLTAYVDLSETTDNGKRKIVFGTPKGFDQYEEIRLPCGKCIGCRLERSRQWAIRCVHEAVTSDKACFITLTYDDVHLHPSGSLKFCKQDFVDFMKRLRKHFSDKRIRFFHCGEYGSLWQRPHHHAIIFGLDFRDLKNDCVIREKTKLGFLLYQSRTLDRLWSVYNKKSKRFEQLGICRVGSCTFESVAYVARYVTKKITGEDAYDHYYGREPEYITMSRRPGIGHDWLFAHPEIYNYDEIVIRNNLHCKPPKYYDKLFEEVAPDYMEFIKDKRKVKALENVKDLKELYRLEEKKLYDAKKLIRSYEKNN